ncbi:hypothetical protein HYV88_01940 [Candidatus Woesearchaeota archaeon]|nr:hypothetical protein [Candidatus Woesearchaeota archaeon]
MGRKRIMYVKEREIPTQEALKNAISLLNNLSKKERKDLENIKNILSPILEKYEAIDLEAREIKIPIAIFINELTILETIVKYLKEEENLSLRNISILLKRDERNIWHTYDNVNKKRPNRLKSEISEIFIPVSIFENRKLSAFENLVSYLKTDLGLRFSEIATLLGRDARTIWTIWSRARKKNAK